MEVRFKQAKDVAPDEYVEVHYDPIGWQLCGLDARTIVPALQQVYETDYHVHCAEEGQEYMTSYDTILEFLAHANLEDESITSIDCVIPIHDEYHIIHIDFKKNTIRALFDKHTENEDVSLFDPAIQKVSHLLSQHKQNGAYSFHKRMKEWKLDNYSPTTIEYIFHPAHRGRHDMIILKAFDQRFHLGTIYTEVWDREKHFWRTFEGYEQYREEAPTDKRGFYEYLHEISFNISIDEIRYRVWVYLADGLSLSRIEIETDETDHPHNFTPIMEELERLIPQRE